MKENSTQKLVYLSLLTALQIVLKRFVSISTPIVRISFSFLPLVLVAVLFGVLPTLISAAISDVAGAFLISGSYFPGFTLSALLTGLTYSLLLYEKPRSAWRVGLAVFITGIPISLFLNTFWLQVITGNGMWALLPSRIMQNVVMMPVKFFVIWVVVYRLVPLAKKNFLPKANKN